MLGDPAAWALVLCAVFLASCRPKGVHDLSFDQGTGSGGGPGSSGNPPPNQVQEIRINEVMVVNTLTVADENGAFPPWVELYNPTDRSVDLSGIALSDDPQAPGKWTFPAGELSVMAAHGFLVVFCDGGPAVAPRLHASFTLSHGALDLVYNRGTDFFLADGGALNTDQSAGRSPDGGSAISVLSAPTPGAANSQPLVASPDLRGDVDRNGRVDLDDVTDILNYLYLGTFTPYCLAAADADVDGHVDLNDALRLEVAIFTGGLPLPGLTEAELEACAHPVNDPPSVPPRPLYHSYPGFPIEFRIDAVDPEGDRLLYQGLDLPPGADLAEDTGTVRWTPAADQIGSFSLTFQVSDEADPPHKVPGRINFQVHPLDPCLRPVCDPAGGCQRVLAPLGESCCGDPGPREADPVFGCPDGRVLQVGRNPTTSATIGRMEDCDLLRLVPLGQGGHTLRLNFEARCLVAKQVLLEARLETPAAVMFNVSARLDFQEFDNGYIQLRNLRFIAEGAFDEGTNLQLTVALTDSTGVKVERKLRLLATRNAIADLP
jgi:lamin tail-like protein/dockerin type I repeat protein/putative Ig domain-containing protein